MNRRMRSAMRATVIAGPVMLAGCADYQQGWPGAAYQAAPPAVAYGGGRGVRVWYAPRRATGMSRAAAMSWAAMPRLRLGPGRLVS